MKSLTPDELGRLATTLASLYVESPNRLSVRAYIRPLEHGEAPPAVDTIIVKFPGTHPRSDHGLLIGARGQNFHALGTILQEAAKPNLLRLFIAEPIGERAQPTMIPLDPTWDKDEAFRQILEHVAEEVFGKAMPVHAAPYPDNLRTVFTLELGEIDPELLSAFQVLWKAIGRFHGRNFLLHAEAPKAEAV